MEWKVVALDTLGCKLNQAETETLGRHLGELGYKVVEPCQRFDIYILNSCTVTHIADSKSRHRLRWARRQNPEAWIIVTGCYAQRCLQELESLPEADLVISNEEKPHLAEIVKQKMPALPVNSGERNPFRTRTFVKIHDGCNNFCSYCIVPYVRGRERSFPPQGIIEEIHKRVEEGYKEVVLTGTNIGSYRWDGINLEGLVKQILSQTNIPRLRLSSLKPGEISPQFLSLWDNPRLCPHFHIPLQSGSNLILGRMGRQYKVEDFEKAVMIIREKIPWAAITTDVIVGFPGEGEEEWGESFSFCQRMGFAAIHIFPFSPRGGTKAAAMSPVVGEKVKRARVNKIAELAHRSTLDFRQRYLGQTLPVLWEGEVGKGVWTGLTGNYLRIFTYSSQPLTNQIMPTKLVSLAQRGLWGVMQ